MRKASVLRFQFYDSPIKRDFVPTISIIATAFQFYDSPIKRTAISLCLATYFVSIL